MKFIGLLLPVVFENQSPQSSDLGCPRCVWLSRNSPLPILCRHQVARSQGAWCLAPRSGTQPATCLLGGTFCSGLRTLGPTLSTHPSCSPSSVLTTPHSSCSSSRLTAGLSAPQGQPGRSPLGQILRGGEALLWTAMLQHPADESSH